MTHVLFTISLSTSLASQTIPQPTVIGPNDCRLGNGLASETICLQCKVLNVVINVICYLLFVLKYYDG